LNWGVLCIDGWRKEGREGVREEGGREGGRVEGEKGTRGSKTVWEE